MPEGLFNWGVTFWVFGRFNIMKLHSEAYIELSENPDFVIVYQQAKLDLEKLSGYDIINNERQKGNAKGCREFFL